MPRFSGVKCEECQARHTSLDDPSAATWWEIYVAKAGTPNIEIHLGTANPGSAPDLETHYLCSPPHLFQHIARLLNIDPTELHREKP